MRLPIPLSRGRVARGMLLGAALSGLLATSVSAATTEVSVNDSKTFSPATVSTSVGGVVHWAATGVDDHSVTQDQRVFDSGLAAPGLDFSRTFSAGTFPYHCEKHAADGMRGQVRVAPQVLAKPAGLPFTVRWAATASNTGDRFDVHYRIGRGAWRTWVSNTTARGAVFGARKKPVRVVRGKTYSFRAVSRVANAGRSGLSPVRSFRVR